MNGIEHLLYMESASELGSGSITLTFEAGTDLDLASVETQNRIKRAEARLPEDVRRLGLTVAKTARNYVMFVALYSPDKSMDDVALGKLHRRQCAGRHTARAGGGRSVRGVWYRGAFDAPVARTSTSGQALPSTPAMWSKRCAGRRTGDW